MKVRSESEVVQSCPTLSDPMDCSPSGSSIHGISMGFSRQEYWSGVPLPSPLKCSTWMQSQKQQNDLSVCFQGKPFNITVIQVYAPTSNAEEAEVEWFYEDLHDFLELTPKKDVLLIIGDWNAKVGSQETPGVTGKFDLGVQNEAGQRLIEF